MHVVTEVDAETGALLARNAFRPDFAGRVAFADVDRRPRTLSADRLSFLGRHGSVAAPSALGRVELAGLAGAALDPCAAIQVSFELEPGAEIEVVFLLGEADGDRRGAQAGPTLPRAGPRRAGAPGRPGPLGRPARRRAGPHPRPAPGPAGQPMAALPGARLPRTGRGRASTSRAGRTGSATSSRTSWPWSTPRPKIRAGHILRAASRQFLEGDVQHWWHPPTGRGIRTRIADDPLWLPFVVSHYVTTTGDVAILDQAVPYLQARSAPARPGGRLRPAGRRRAAGLALRSLRPGLRSRRPTGVGAHGLPLMRHGDWNDGMNRVGSQGKGESVWLAWFAIAGLGRFAALAESRGDSERATAPAAAGRDASHRPSRPTPGTATGTAARYFDDGTPLGSAQNDACRIDSIAQSWAVLSGAGRTVAGSPRRCSPSTNIWSIATGG